MGNSPADAFLKRKDIKILDWQQIKKEEEGTAVMDACHVFFFEQPLSEHDRQLFDERIVGFFRGLDSDLLKGKARTVSAPMFLHDGNSAEFTATTPAGDETWFGDLYTCCLDFSRNVVRIASYQGKRFD
jgi:hypothetical protein